MLLIDAGGGQRQTLTARKQVMTPWLIGHETGHDAVANRLFRRWEGLDYSVAGKDYSVAGTARKQVMTPRLID